jgi:hypothetical protein
MRSIYTKFWNDTWVRNLDKDLKLLFLYFLTNDHCEIGGVYEIPLSTIEAETGLTINQEVIKKLEPKIFYFYGWIWVVNFRKYHKGSRKLEEGIKSSLKDIPNLILEEIRKKSDILSIPYLGEKVV